MLGENFSCWSGCVFDQSREDSLGELLNINLNFLDKNEILGTRVTLEKEVEIVKDEILDRIESSYREYFKKVCWDYYFKIENFNKSNIVITDNTVDKIKSIDNISKKANYFLYCNKIIKKCLEFYPCDVLRNKDYRYEPEDDELLPDIKYILLPDDEILNRKNKLINEVHKLKQKALYEDLNTCGLEVNDLYEYLNKFEKKEEINTEQAIGIEEDEEDQSQPLSL